MVTLSTRFFLPDFLRSTRSMARRKPPSKSSRGGSEAIREASRDQNGGAASSENDPEAGPPPAASQAASPPSSTVMTLISIAVVLHLFVLLMSYSAIIEPSSTHTQLLELTAPYLRSTHFAADGRPFYLAHATPDEQPHRLQFASRGQDGTLSIDQETRWTTIEPSGIAGLASWDRYGRWMGLIATLAQSDRQSLAAALLMPLVEADSSIDAVRIIRLPTELTTVEQDAAPPVYLARVIRDSGEVRLVSIGAKRLSTYSREASLGGERETASGGESEQP